MCARLNKQHTKAGVSVFTSALLCLVLLLTAQNLIAQQKTYKHRDANGNITFSDAPVRNGIVTRNSYKSVTREPVAANPCHGMTRAKLDIKGGKLDSWFKQAERLHGVDASLLKAVARAESCFDARAVSRAGAKGLMQLMPPTAKEMGVTDIFDAQQNLLGGARYLAAMMKRYSSNLELALAAYNAGPGNVDRYNGIPPFKETQHYIKTVKSFQTRYAQLQTRSLQLTASN